MCSEDLLKGFEGFPFVLVINQVIIGVSEQFIDMTEYKEDELLNCNISDIFRTLRVGPNIDIDNIDTKAGYFIFTKSLEVRFVNIEVVKDFDKQIYIINENPNSRLEDKLNYLYMQIAENIERLFICSVPDFTLLKASQIAFDIFDAIYKTPENTFGKPVCDFIAEWKDIISEAVLRHIVETEKPKRFKEYRHENFQRGITYWDITLTPVKDEGNVKYLVINAQDVSEKVVYRQKLEEQNETIKSEHITGLVQKSKELAQKNRQLEAIICNMSDGLIFVEKSPKFMFLNSPAKAFFNNPHEIKNVGDSVPYNKYFYDIDGKEIPLEDLPSFRVFSRGKFNDYRLTIVHPDKKLYASINGSPIYDEDGNMEAAVLFAHDITEKVKYEQELRAQSVQLEAIVQNMSDALFIINADHSFRYHNKRVKDMVYRPEEMQKAGDSILYTKYYDMSGRELSRHELPSLRVLKGEKLDNVILKAISPDRVSYLSFNGSPAYDSEGNMTSATVCVRDMTCFVNQELALEEKQLKLLQIEREKNETLEKAIEMKDEFLSLISHEFRTPLNVINTALQIIYNICGGELSDKAKKYLGMIKQNTFRQLRLVNNLLDITRVNVGRIKISKKNIDIVFLTKAITESVHTYAYQKGVSVTFISALEKKIVGIDDEKYERILLNLLSNAIKFTPEGKSIVVSLRSIKGNICIKVKDNGIGIPSDKLDIIFERFGQVDSSLSRQAEGSGIGLSLVKKFVEALGGSISVKSKVGSGSTFTILIPSERIIEEHKEKEMIDLMDNRLIQSTKVEFSDIYLE